MHVVAAIAIGFAALLLFLCGWLFLFRTGALIAHAQHRHRGSPLWIQKWPFHHMIFKPWYPAYLRCGGIVAWLTALCLIAVALMTVLR